MNSVTLFSSFSKRTAGVFYGWWLVGLSGFIMMLAHVPLFHAMGVWAVALEHEFGWSRTQLGLALTVYQN